MAKDNDDKPVNGLDKLVNTIERGGAKSKILRELEEKASASTSVLSTFKADANAPQELIKKIQEKAALDQYKLIEEQRSRLSSSQSQIAKTISNQFSEREFARQVHVNMREGDVPTSQYTGQTFAQLKKQQYQSNVSTQQVASNAKSGIDPGTFYGIDPNTGETSLVGGGDPYRKALQEQATVTRSSAGVSLALQSRRQEGSDPNSMLATGGKLLAREQTRLENIGIKEDVKSGKFDAAEETKKLSDSGNKLAETMKKLSDAFEKFDASSDASVETLSKAEKEFEQVTKEYEKQSKVVKEIKAQGGQGGQAVSSAIGVATSVIDVARNQFITSNIAQNNLRAAYAGASNEQFFDQANAAKGDAGSLRRMTSGFYDYANKQFGNYKGIAGTLAGGEAAATGIDAAVGTTGVMQLAKGGATVNETAVKAGSALKQATNFSKGLYASDAFAARDSIKNLDTATNAVGDASMQKFIDFNMKMGRSLIGAGSKGGYDSVNKQAETLAGYGISPDQAASLFGQGSAQIGSNFLKNPGMLSAAGKAQSMGIMSAESYLGNVGTLTQAGGGQKDMEAILANAVSRGMDNAKSISAMVGSITSLASTSAASGVSAVSGNAQLFMSRLDMSKNNGLSDEMRQAGAMKDVSDLSKLTSNQNLTTQTMVEQSYMATHMPNVKFQTRVNAQKATLPELMSIKAGLRGTKEEKAEAEANQERLNIAAMSKENIDEAIQAKKEGLLTLAIQGGMNEKRGREIIEGRGAKKTKEEGDILGFGIGAASSTITHVDRGAASKTATGATGSDMEAIGVTQAGAKADFKMFQSVRDLGVTVGNLSTAMNTLANTLDPNKAQAQSMGAANAMTLDKESLGNFASGASDLKAAAAELRVVIKPMMGAVDFYNTKGAPSTIGKTLPIGGAFGTKK